VSKNEWTGSRKRAAAAYQPHPQLTKLFNSSGADAAAGDATGGGSQLLSSLLKSELLGEIGRGAKDGWSEATTSSIRNIQLVATLLALAPYHPPT